MCQLTENCVLSSLWFFATHDFTIYIHLVWFLTHFWPFIAYRLNEWVGCEEVTDIQLVCQLTLPQFGCGLPSPSSRKWIKAQSKNIKAAYTAKTLCVKCWTLAKINTSNPDLYSCWFRVEVSQGAQKYPHPHPHWGEKIILIPIPHLCRSVSRQSVVDGGKLITSSEETTSLKMVIVILISWLSSWIQFLFLGNYLPSHVPCQIQSFL